MQQVLHAVSTGFRRSRLQAATLALAFTFALLSQQAAAQSRNYTTLNGTVVDPTGAVVPGAVWRYKIRSANSSARLQPTRRAHSPLQMFHSRPIT
ncbi:MAG: hypothetical protein JOZ10_01895 [Acidobacteria bacterium]|nr:hypothetical protein [Acidobacteriota bacterium]